MYTTYILYSFSRNRFYSGHCEQMTKRLEQHNTGRNKSTKSGIPWKIVFTQEFSSRSEAATLESRIKKRGASRFLSDINITVG